MSAIVAPALCTYAQIEQKVRQLTASASESSLTTAALNQYINDVYLNDFAYGIKIDQMRSVYTFFTQPNIDRYPLDVNYSQGVRAPMYVEGILGNFTKDRMQFYNVWPKFPTLFQQGPTDIAETDNIVGVTLTTASTPGVTLITSENPFTETDLSIGDVITINGIVGTTQLNGNQYTVVALLGSSLFSINVDSTLFSPYISGGNWATGNQTFSFTIAAPFLSKEVVIGGVDQGGNAITINDDGYGNLQLLSGGYDSITQSQVISPNPITYNPPLTSIPAIPGMLNINEGNPGLYSRINIGNVNYVTGLINFSLPSGTALSLGTLFTVWVSQYQTGRPYSLLFWNNEFTIRPVPKLIHKVEIEIFLTPVQFMMTSDSPILNQWWKYIAYLAARQILLDRQDMEGLENIEVGLRMQEALVLERQGIEEINQPTYTLFNSSTPAAGGIGGIGYFL